MQGTILHDHQGRKHSAVSTQRAPACCLKDLRHGCRWAVLVNPLLTKPPENNALCTAWILQGPFDLSTWLNWWMFYQGSQGVRNSFLDLWEYLAGENHRSHLNQQSYFHVLEALC